VAFRTTRWSLIARATRGDDEVAVRALDELCRIYWPAVYALYRGEGIAVEEARDLTQGLFTVLLERGDFGKADRERARFRSYLSACARHWLANQRDRERALKRGGGVALVPLVVDDDAVAGEERRLVREPIDARDAEAWFERRWAQALIEHALAGLAAEERAAGRGVVFDLVEPSLSGASPPRPWAELADELGTTEGALRVAAHRLRQRFRDRVAREVRETLGEDVSEGEELAVLLAALQG
jgi:RNA polymerase sigma factor (sigma-70 family)